jgi:hypothetical protein
VARDDWRIRIELPEEGAATRMLERLGLDLGSDARELARELEGHRLAVSRDGHEIFVYARSRRQAEQARRIVDAEVGDEQFAARTSRIERWLADEERWDAEPAGETWEEETLERGYAPWEVRVDCASRAEADELGDRLESEGQSVVRRHSYLLVGAASEEEARELARRLHGEVEPGGELFYEVGPQNPFAVFGGLGGSGTPF